MWAARVAVRDAAARPRSPLDSLPDAFGALRFLAAQLQILSTPDRNVAVYAS